MTEIYTTLEPFFNFINDLIFYKFFGTWSIGDIFIPMIVISLVITLLGLLSGFIIDIGKGGSKIADDSGKQKQRRKKK